MAISINRNPAASALLALARAQADGASASERLASGRRINSARDDAAGLAISVRMSAQIAGLGVAARNSLDAISMTQTAEGGLSSIGANLQRLRELAVQAANATNSSSDRAALQLEAAALVDEADRVARSTRFNGLALLDGSFVSAAFQIGAGVGQTIDLGGLVSVRAAALGIVQPPPPPATTAVAGNTLSAASTITGPGQLVINGVDVWQGSTVDADARSLAAAVNAAGIAGVSMAAAPNVVAGTWSNGPSSGQVSVDGGAGGVLSYFFGTLDEATMLNIMTSIFSGTTFAPGIVGTNTGNGITLTRADGGNMAFNFFSGSPEILGLGGLTYGVGYDGVNYGHAVLSYDTAAGVTVTGSKAAALGLAPGTVAAYVPPSGGMLDKLDLSTAASANDALVTLDACLQQVDSQRASLGAAQNRFTAAITATRDASAQASAARSRIVDADYASETAGLVRATILQAAGTAMVAQANAHRSDVLRLLKG